jgi:hypothetical protein
MTGVNAWVIYKCIYIYIYIYICIVKSTVPFQHMLTGYDRVRLARHTGIHRKVSPPVHSGHLPPLQAHRPYLLGVTTVPMHVFRRSSQERINKERLESAFIRNARKPRKHEARKAEDRTQNEKGAVRGRAELSHMTALTRLYLL